MVRDPGSSLGQHRFLGVRRRGHGPSRSPRHERRAPRVRRASHPGRNGRRDALQGRRLRRCGGECTNFVGATLVVARIGQRTSVAAGRDKPVPYGISRAVCLFDAATADACVDAAVEALARRGDRAPWRARCGRPHGTTHIRRRGTGQARPLRPMWPVSTHVIPIIQLGSAPGRFPAQVISPAQTFQCAVTGLVESQIGFEHRSKLTCNELVQRHASSGRKGFDFASRRLVDTDCDIGRHRHVLHKLCYTILHAVWILDLDTSAGWDASVSGWFPTQVVSRAKALQCAGTGLVESNTSCGRGSRAGAHSDVAEAGCSMDEGIEYR